MSMSIRRVFCEAKVPGKISHFGRLDARNATKLPGTVGYSIQSSIGRVLAAHSRSSTLDVTD
jgi:hypothetical protein